MSKRDYIIGKFEDVDRRASPFQKSLAKTVSLQWNQINFQIGDKKVLENVSGKVDPGQVVAIMGPSGCGKTSLLNLLSGRKGFLMQNDPGLGPGNLFKKSELEGEIRANGRVFTNQEFSQFGAFVQQDDVLVENMTPQELFDFACRIRTRLTPSQIQCRVSSLIEALQLEACKDTAVGDVLKRGVSGGERKRTSIGYELITNPSVLFLDEPTSGLDSVSAQSVMALLRQEAERGMTILATIHQPSSKIFNGFDRVMVLSGQGQVAYHNTPRYSIEFFRAMGQQISNYKNPADELLKLAHNPELFGSEFAKKYSDLKHSHIMSDMGGLVQQSPFSDSYERRANFMQQLYLLSARFLTYIFRDPQSLIALYAISLFQCLLMCSIFNGIGAQRIWDFDDVKKARNPFAKRTMARKYLAHNLEVSKDYNGFVFFQSTDMFLTIAYAQVLQMPKLSDVYRREMQNKMYSPSAFFLAKYFVTTLVYIFQPLMYSVIAFHLLEFNDQSPENLQSWVKISLTQGVLGSSFGFMFSQIFSESMNALIFLNQYLCLIYFSAGVFATISAGGKNWFLNLFSPQSPFTYTCEEMMSVFLNGLPYKEKLLEFYQMNRGTEDCYTNSFKLILAYFTIAWTVTIIKSKIMF